MSYVLAFWRQDPPPSDPQSVYLALNEAEGAVSGVEQLPVDVILERIPAVFAGAEVRRACAEVPFHGFFWEGPTGGALDGTLTNQALIVSAHGFPEDDMNRLIDLALEFQAPLYDPQVGQRFDGRG